MGSDMNVYIGRDIQHHKFLFHETTNRNGEHLQIFPLENKMHCMNTRILPAGHNSRWLMLKTLNLV